MNPKLLLFAMLIMCSTVLAQVPGLEAKNWYFGIGTDGLQFNSPIAAPAKLNNKVSGVGFEGMIVVNDPVTGNLLFYSDGISVIDSTAGIMHNGTGLLGSQSGAQCIQCLPIPNTVDKYYLLTNSSADNTTGILYYSIVDFTDSNYPNGKITNKNTLVGPNASIYRQANKLIPNPCQSSYWWIIHKANSAQYDVYSISSSGFSGPTTYTFAHSDVRSYAMAYSSIAGKLAISNVFVSGGIGLTLFDFDSATGVLSNENRISSDACSLGNFSPDGSKLYFGKAINLSLHQYDLATGVTTNMSTCCFSHDTKIGLDGKMYHLHTYNSATPLAVINNPNLSAIANACDYQLLPSYVFNGHVRRFPEFVTLPCVVLPVEFIDFSAALVSNEIALKWEIASNVDWGHFEIQRSNDKLTFNTIARIEKRADEFNYEYADEGIDIGRYFYRIKYIDINGENSFTQMEEVHVLNFETDILLFPVPCKNELNISLSNYNPSSNFYEFSVIDYAGRVLLISNDRQLSVKNLNAGVYVLKLNINGQIQYRTFYKN